MRRFDAKKSEEKEVQRTELKAWQLISFLVDLVASDWTRSCGKLVELPSDLISAFNRTI